MSKYLQTARIVEAEQWGPSWGQMKKVAEWLGAQGIPFQFNHDAERDDDETDELPGLWLYDRRWTPFEVRRKDWLVLYGHGDVRVFSREQFKAEFERSGE